MARKTAPHRGTGKKRAGAGDGPSKAELMEQAKRRDIPGRSRMSKDELRQALGA